MTYKIVYNLSTLILCIIFSVKVNAQLIINEIMSKPINGKLPNHEYIELLNSSDTPIQISNFQLSYNSTRMDLPPYILAPQQYLILTNNLASVEFEKYGNAIAIQQWQTLSNTSARLELISNNNIIDQVTYKNSIHTSTTKQNGGWSLERINPHWSCDLTDNWTSSLSPNGGTPGRRNSVQNKNSLPHPKITSTKVYANALKITFNVASELLQLINKEHFEINNNMGTPNLLEWNSTKDTLNLIFNNTFLPNKIYTLSSKPIDICSFQITFPNEIVLEQ